MMNKKVLIIINAVLLVITIVLVCLLLGVGGKKDAALWQEQYDLGVRYFLEGNYEAAVLAFQAAMQIDPYRAEAYTGAAQAYIALGDEESAVQVLGEGYANTGDGTMKEWVDWYEAEQTRPTTVPMVIPTPSETEPPATTQPPEPQQTEPPATTEPAQQSRFLTEAEIMTIACDYWQTQPGDINPDTGFVMGIQIQDGPTESNPKYVVALRWLVDDGTTAWWSTIDIIGIDAITGAIVSPY